LEPVADIGLVPVVDLKNVERIPGPGELEIFLDIGLG